MRTQLTQAREGISRHSGTEAENILGAAREDAGFEKLLKFKKGELPHRRRTCPAWHRIHRARLSAGPNAGSSS